MSDAAIAIEGVTKTFGSTTAVRDLDLVVPRGSLCGFLGPNGAGKTTTIRMIMSIIFPDTGRISVLDKPDAIQSKDRIGYLPEERGVYRKMKATEFIAYVGALKGIDIKVARRKAKEWMERLGLGDAIGKKCEEMSKGMQQKVQIASCLIHDPELVILDEPFSGLDPVNARLMRELVLETNRQGVTFIFSTHVLHQAEQMCDRIFMINRGEKIIDDTLAGIRERFDPRTILVRFGAAETDLRSIEGVRDAHRVKEEWELHVEERADPREVMRRIFEALPDVRKVELRQPTLDDVFITLVEEARVDEFGQLEVATA